MRVPRSANSSGWYKDIDVLTPSLKKLSLVSIPQKRRSHALWISAAPETCLILHKPVHPASAVEEMNGD